jgi:hypothetical protein
VVTRESPQMFPAHPLSPQTLPGFLIEAPERTSSSFSLSTSDSGLLLFPYLLPPAVAGSCGFSRFVLAASWPSAGAVKRP